MKYSKEYEAILQDPAIPAEWRASAIEYRQLKKLIKQVVKELESMGLNPEILHRIMKPEDEHSDQHRGHAGKITPDRHRAASSSDHTDEDDDDEDDDDDDDDDDEDEDEQEAEDEELEFEFDEFGSPSKAFKSSSLGNDLRAKEARDAAIVQAGHHFHVRLNRRRSSQHSGDGDGSHGSESGSADQNDLERQKHGDDSGQEVSRRTMHHEKAPPASVRARYSFSGTGDHPHPQIRFVLDTSPRPASAAVSSGPSPSRSRDKPDQRHNLRSISAGGIVNRDRSDSPAASPRSDKQTSSEEPSAELSSTTGNTPSAEEVDSDDEADMPTPRLTGRASGAELIPQSPTLQKIQGVSSPIWALSSGATMSGFQSLSANPSPPVAEMAELELEESALDPADHVESVSASSQAEPQSVIELGEGENDILDGETIPVIVTPAQQEQMEGSQHAREIVVDLPSDVAFFQLLCQALNSLSALHASQQAMFNTQVQRICSLVSQSITPTSSKMPSFKSIPVPHVKGGKPQDGPLGDIPAPTAYGKSDLYAWRQIFTLWIEAQIFESTAERDRGERPVEEAERRLKAFADEVVKRGLGDRRTLRRKESREAWDDFLRLNVLLLDLKRFQLANINAARKILKKHDKRTALTASVGFPQFVRQSLEAHMDTSGRITAWTFYDTSLPHVLLASLTETLLPILPSLDDYMCLICTSIAFKPIRLNCGHLFCVRCLAKMQRKGTAFCPLCRAPNVLTADKSSLDLDTMEYMQKWFPLEVKQKQKENDRDLARQQLRDSGLEHTCVLQ